jgi:hypothetical protein
MSADPAAPFWAAAAEGRLDLPFCEDCGKPHMFPRDRCPHCGSARLARRAASGRGEVYSFSVVHRAPTPAFAAEAPYTIAIVKLAEGPHLMGRLNAPPDAARIGMPVHIGFGDSPAAGRIAIFTPEVQP